MTALLTSALFSAAFAIAVSTIADTVIPQLDRICALLAGEYEA